MTAIKLAAIVSVATLCAACAATTESGPDSSMPGQTSAQSRPTEGSSPTPRLALSYDGGILVVDADSLEQVADIPVDGFVRLNPAGNDRHVLVSGSDGFTVLDMGTWTDAHGDHGHHYTADPTLTDLRFGGAEPGHAVVHDEMLTLFSDGIGTVDLVDPDVLLDGKGEARRVTSTAPHHGVAVVRQDGTLVISIGDDNGRSGVEIRDAADRRVVANEDCPGVHGEAAAHGGVLTFGCEDGALIVRGNEIRKVNSPDAYGRIGNHAGSPHSTIVLGDYKTDPDAEIERPRRFALIDTENATLRVVPIDASYSFRSLDRGPAGEAVILGTDGALHVYDPVTAQGTARIEVIDAWTEPERWQAPMPNLHVQGGTAYVTDPAARRLVAVDMATGTTVAETTLPQPTVELTGVRG
ncbi:zinc metallochaperone AztD [Mycolicibacterium vaccae]|uniref:zinc metallochaperone AztD n=1 Tax=Mycolicibacterium vaccae TaxID=1810 RepID=UPI003CEF1710